MSKWIRSWWFCTFTYCCYPILLMRNFVTTSSHHHLKRFGLPVNSLQLFLFRRMNFSLSPSLFFFSFLLSLSLLSLSLSPLCLPLLPPSLSLPPLSFSSLSLSPLCLPLSLSPLFPLYFLPLPLLLLSLLLFIYISSLSLNRRELMNEVEQHIVSEIY